jgi:AraC family transcriptional regulator
LKPSKAVLRLVFEREEQPKTAKKEKRERCMSSRLDRIDDWEIRASASHYNYDKLVKACSTSRSQLRRYFLAKFGKTPHEWMDDLRLAEAVRLLKASDLTVKEIAARLGYDYPGNFARQFKRRHGCNPSEYATQGGSSDPVRPGPLNL